jgi:hypothetical protein
MKSVAAVFLLVVVSTDVLCVEYAMAMRLGLGLLLITACGLAVIGVELYRAPQGFEGSSALCICQSTRRATRIPHHRLSQVIRVRL